MGTVVVAGLLVLVGNARAAAPVAQFEMSPEAPRVSQKVTFTDTSYDPDGRIVRREWDLNDDGVITDPSGSRVVSRAYHTAGDVRIFLRVTDNSGETSTTTRVLRVGGSAAAPTPTTPTTANRVPVAAFSYSPSSPTVGQVVSFASSSQDADGSIVTQLWDLDGDGAFDDAGGATAQHVFALAQPQTVSLQVTDDRGASAVAFQTVTPREPATGQIAGTAAQPQGPAGASRSTITPIRPFPVVRVRGRVVAGATVVDLFSVRAPAGATVRIRCRGRSCPHARFRLAARLSRVPVRVRGLERRLRGTTTVEVLVTKPGRIGKYTRLRFRPGAAPVRVDRCLPSSSWLPVSCTPAATSG